MESNNILEALKYIDASATSYEEWVQVGMALKTEGYDWTVWDSWSQADKRYKPGECERKWKTFTGFGWDYCADGKGTRLHASRL